MQDAVLNTSGRAQREVVVVSFVYRLGLEKDELLSIKKMYKHTEGKHVAIVIKESLASDLSLQRQILDIDLDGRLSIVPIKDSHLDSVASYNQLMMSAWFYRLFIGYDYMLIHQLDCILTKDEIDHWVEQGYSYIGAPWFGALQGFKCYHQFTGVGNGGLSLRSIHDSIFVLENIHLYGRHIFSFSEFLVLPITGIKRKVPFMTWGHCMILAFLSLFGYHNRLWFFAIYKRSRVNEDIFWGFIVPRVVNWFSIPSPRTAARFALETNHREAKLFYNLGEPFGYHAWKKYTVNLEEFE